MTIMEALLIALIVWGFIVGERWLAFPMISQPLVVGPVVGLILGDFTFGIIAGGTLQLVFLGVMQLGGMVPPDAVLGTAVGVAFAITTGQDVETALLFAVPVAMLGSTFIFTNMLIRSLFNPLAEKFCAQGNDKALRLMHILLSFIPDSPRAITMFFGLLLGAGPAERLIEVMPDVLIGGLQVSTGMMAAVGIALLLRMIWSKAVAVYFFAGFLLVAFFNVPMIAVASVGVVLAMIIYREVWTDKPKAAIGAESGAEEELFDE